MRFRKLTSPHRLFLRLGGGLFFVFAFSSLGSTGANVQLPDQKPVIYSTPPKEVQSRIMTGNPDNKKGYSLRGKTAFAISHANDDDTLTGTLIFTLPDESREKIAKMTGKSRKEIAIKIRRSGMKATFKPGTACPVLSLQIQDPWLEIEGMKISFSRLNLEVLETPEEMAQLLCTWRRQVNAKRHYRSVISAINRLLSPES